MYMSGIEYFLIGLLAVLAMFIVWVFAIGLPISIEHERQFVAACTQAGGVPSKYETMVGKTSHSERLCIKKENIVEIGE